MGVFDDMTILLGRGMDAADKRSQELKIQSELNRLAAQEERALAELGRAVLAREGGQADFTATYGSHLQVIDNIQTQEGALKRQLEEVRTHLAPVGGDSGYAAPSQRQGMPCPQCGASVTLDTMYCPSCGDNLAALKEQHKRCPNCGTFSSKDSMYCSRCGGMTVAIEVAPYRSV